MLREVMKTPKLDFCGMTSSSVRNPLYTHMFKVLNESHPGIIHECPYKSLIVENLHLKMEFFPILPPGEYKVIYNWTKFNGDRFVCATMTGTIISTDTNKG